jgi:mRNA interferase MazF
MKRGDLYTAVFPKNQGKPRPALIIQDDAFLATTTVTLLPLTTHLSDVPAFRVRTAPTPGNGLRVVSEVQVDKAQTVPRSRLEDRIGTLDEATMQQVDRALAGFLGLHEWA